MTRAQFFGAVAAMIAVPFLPKTKKKKKSKTIRIKYEVDSTALREAIDRATNIKVNVRKVGVTDL